MKKRQWNILIVCLFAISGFTNFLFAQGDTALEEQYIESFSNDNVFDLLFLSDNPSKGRDMLWKHKNEFYRTLAEFKKRFKNNRSSIYNLYDVIHNKYFVKYEESIKFYNVFQGGRYNCLTGTAMYAMALEYLEIPYKILEEPSHVFLVVFHSTGNYVFESTRPATSAILVDKKYIKWYKELLVENKVATLVEVSKPGFVKREIYNGDQITLKELVGDQYGNNAITYSNSEDFENALIQAEMAYQLNPSAKMESLIRFAAISIIKTSHLSDETLCDLVHVLDYYEDHSDFDNKELGIIVNNAFYSFFKESFEPDRIEEFMNCLLKVIEDPDLAQNIESNGNRLLTRHYLGYGDLVNAKMHLDMCHNQQAKEVFDLARVIFIRTAETLSFERPEVVLDTLKHFEVKYPKLKTDRDILRIKSGMLLYAASLRFDKNHRKKGEAFINLFIEQFDKSEESLYTPDLIGAAFGSYSAYYVRGSNHERASEILVRGLEYDPDNIHLLRKKGYLDDENK